MLKYVLQVRFIADPTGEFTNKLELDFDATKVFGNVRSKRYALVVENGKVKYVNDVSCYISVAWTRELYANNGSRSAHVEPDGTGTNESMADKVLGASDKVDWNA